MTLRFDSKLDADTGKLLHTSLVLLHPCTLSFCLRAPENAIEVPQIGVSCRCGVYAQYNPPMGDYVRRHVEVIGRVSVGAVRISAVRRFIVEWSSIARPCSSRDIVSVARDTSVAILPVSGLERVTVTHCE
jgi:hypothetical protein